MRLRAKVAIVTGSADGIGRSTALRLAAEGAKVVIADIQEDKGHLTARHIVENGGDSVFIRCDVGESPEVEELMEQTVKRFGTLDILNNNAAIDFFAPLSETGEETWQRVLNVNLSGVYRGCKFALPYMKQAGGGSIINIASVQAWQGFPGYSAYASAKGGIIALTQQLAVELAPFNIRINSVSPGAINTPMTQLDLVRADDPAKLLKELESLHAINRLGEPYEVANAVLFLASDESSFMTGTDLKVDGGLVIKPASGV